MAGEEPNVAYDEHRQQRDDGAVVGGAGPRRLRAVVCNAAQPDGDEAESGGRK